MPAPVWITLLAVFAGYTASFACVVLERRLDERKPDGRSRCVCGSPIPMYRNIPVLSWLSQHGRAACCGARIPTWYFVAETAFVSTALALALALGYWGAGLIGIGVATIVLAIWHHGHFADARNGKPSERKM